MVSVLRTLQAEWNALVPQAQALGIRRVRHLNDPLETIANRRAKLDWLRTEIATRSGLQALTAQAQDTTSPTPVHPAVDLSVFTFGVELELMMPVGFSRETLALRLQQDAGIVCRAEGYNHNTGPSWKLVQDGSLGDYTRGAELVSPVLRGDDGLDQLRRACLVLKAVGCKVTQKCGLHVHVGARSWGVQAFRNLSSFYYRAQVQIDRFMAPSRRARANMFCNPVEYRAQLAAAAQDVAAVARACGQSPGSDTVRGSGRYRKLNLQSYWQHGTVEFRHHQGTVEAEKALAWVKFCLHVAAAAQSGSAEGALYGTLAEVFDAINLSDDLRAFFQGRADYFASVSDRTTNEDSPSRRRGLPPARPSRPAPQVGLPAAAGDDNFTQAAAALRERAYRRT